MPKPHRPSKQELVLLVENWNLKHPVGTPVTVRKDDGTTVNTVTESKAQVLGNHSAVIWLRDIRGSYSLDRVTATTT